MEQRRQEITQKLIDFCIEPRTLQEISDYLGYSEKYKMKRKYIDPLLGTFLQMTSSSSKNDPTQKYVTVCKASKDYK